KLDTSTTTMATTVLLVLIALVAAAAAAIHGPFTEDFIKFLEKSPGRNEYSLSTYKEYGSSGTFGGRTTRDEKVTEQPVLFVHGNADSALHHSDLASGWTKSVDHFKGHRYSGAALYGLTYGGRDINMALQSTISCRNLLGLRRFIEAIVEYTEAEKIDVIAHSMGVTLARKAIKGGQVHLSGESCDLGEPISDRIDAFVAISGANYGMCMCLVAGIDGMPACGQKGYAPGTCGRREASMADCMDETDECEGEDYAGVLKAVNGDEEKEAYFVASIYSNDDAVLGKNNLVWGKKTSVVPGSDLTHAYQDLDHFQTKDKTVRDQLSLVSKHSLHASRANRHL
ncbi:hypothetical protein PENTCL1PPCAC_28600, partial [Pristionchus entomophagus]